MAKWYLGKIAYLSNDGTGKIATLTETRLFDAVSYTEAEARLTEIVTEAGIHDLSIKTITPQRLSEVFETSLGDIFYRAKVNFLVFNERTQKEKKVPYFFIINADSLTDALNEVSSRMGTINDYEIAEIKQTNIISIHSFA